MDNATLSLVILSVVVAQFAWNRLPVEIIAVGAALTLYFTGLLPLRHTRKQVIEPGRIPLQRARIRLLTTAPRLEKLSGTDPGKPCDTRSPA